MLADNKPVFIVGSGRSGTSVLTWCLGQHPNILPLPETHWIARLTVHMRQLYQFGTVHGRFSHLGALGWSEDEFYAEFGKFVDGFIVNTREPRLRFIRKLSEQRLGLSEPQIDALESGGRLSPDPDFVSARNYQIMRSKNDPKGRWVDGGPENTFYMFSLSRLFPEARFIHILRNPNDVANSLMRFSQAGAAGVDQNEREAYAKWHKSVDYAVKGEKALGPERVLRIHYEDLIGRSEETLRQCLNFLGEEFIGDVLLPLQEKINSSGIDPAQSRLKPTTSEGENANEFYRSLLDAGQGGQEASVLEELELHFKAYADEINR